MAAGAPKGLMPLGLDALDMLRIESGLIFAGYEFDDQVDPFEAGIGFTVNLDIDEDFVGKEALIERKAHPQRTLVGLELAGNETAGHGDCVHEAGGRSQIGVITSGHAQPDAAQERRAVPDVDAVRRGRHGGRGRQARRPPEADPGDGRAVPVLRPEEGAPAQLSRGGRRRPARGGPRSVALGALRAQLLGEPPRALARGNGIAWKMMWRPSVVTVGMRSMRFMFVCAKEER